MSNILQLKSIRELLDLKFFIPDYQRGYRWTRQQVKDLLQDILVFSQLPIQKDFEFYCLQPLVVKELSPEAKRPRKLPENETWYEVIDGQQRLTTLLLILWSREAGLKTLSLPTTRYEMKFARGLDIKKEIENYLTTSEIDDSDMDSYHLTNSLAFIQKWFEETEGAGNLLFPLLNHDPVSTDKEGPNENTVNKDKARNIRFIWYESDEKDPIKIFTRLNIGKIALTNSELIKALMLNRSNFGDDEDYHIKLRQREIASEWDNIENTLHHNDFWSFLFSQPSDNSTRIDVLFDIIVKSNLLKLEEKTINHIGNDKYHTFRYFYEYFSSPNADVLFCWATIKSLFNTFKEWYEDIELYHYIGFLNNISKKENGDWVELDLNYFYSKWEKSTDKSHFKRFIREQVKSKVLSCPLDTQFKDDGSDKGKARPVLLFHNVQTSINQNKSFNGHLSNFYRFPFHLYQSEKWDVEHINSNTTNDESDEMTRNEWLANIYLGINDSIKSLIDKYFEAVIPEEKNAIYNDIKTKFKDINSNSANTEWSIQEKNRIWNYCLLDSSTNRSYGNSIFSAKRRVLIGKEKGVNIGIPIIKGGQLEIPEEKQAKSCFVPISTKHVFLKYYSPTSDVNNYWTKEIDAIAYLKDIEKCIKQLMPIGSIEKKL